MKPTVEIDFVKEGSIALAMNGLDKGLSFLAFIYFANYFEPAAFGAAYAVIGVSVLARSVPFSIGISIRKRISETPHRHAAYFTLGILLLLAYTLVLYAILVTVLSTVTVRYEALALAGLVHMMARSYLFIIQQVAQATGHIGNASVLEFIDGLVTVAAKVGLIIGVGYGAEGLLYGPTIAAVFTATGFYSLLFDHYLERPSVNQAIATFRFFRWDVSGRIPSMILSKSETALVGMFIGPVSASFIKSAKTSVEPGFLPVTGLAQSVFVETSGRSSNGLSFGGTVRKGIRYAGVFSLPLLFGAMLFGERLMVALFGDAYSGTGIVLVAAAVTIVSQSYRQVFISTIQGADRPNYITYVHVALGLVYVPVYGILLINDAFLPFVGAFASSYIVEAVVLGVITRYRVVGERIIDLRFLTEQVVAGVVMYSVLASVDAATSITGIGALAVTISVGAIVYGVSLLTISPRLRSRAREGTARVFAMLNSETAS